MRDKCSLSLTHCPRWIDELIAAISLWTWPTRMHAYDDMGLYIRQRRRADIDSPLLSVGYLKTPQVMLPPPRFFCWKKEYLSHSRCLSLDYRRVYLRRCWIRGHMKRFTLHVHGGERTTSTVEPRAWRSIITHWNTCCMQDECGMSKYTYQA